jgi:hypothetical protein
MSWQKNEPITINNTSHNTTHRKLKIEQHIHLLKTVGDIQVLPDTLNASFMLFRCTSCDKLYSILNHERGQGYRSATTTN